MLFQRLVDNLPELPLPEVPARIIRLSQHHGTGRRLGDR
jgi:hypothetical protein